MPGTSVYNPLHPDTLANPYPLYAELREQAPIFWHERSNSWALTRYRECREVLRDNETFARDRRRVGVEIPEFLQNIQTLDPPALTPLKNVLSDALRSQDLDAMGQRARKSIEHLFLTLAEREQFDWIHEVAAPVALSVTSELFGVEQPAQELYVPLSDSIARRMDIGLEPGRAASGNDAKNQLNKLVKQWYAAEDRPGVLSTIRRTGSEAGVPEHYIRNTTGVMFNASYGTLFATISNVALALVQHPEALDTIRQRRDEKLLETAVDELIRFEGPAQGTSRVAARPTTIAGQPIERGDVVLALVASANRDPREFTRPEELVLDRAPNRHLAFGWGLHGCLGAVFGRIAVREIIYCLAEAPDLWLAGTPKRRTTATVRSLDLLPLTFRQPA